MSTVLTCDCGARFEVEAVLAGQQVTCPDCHQPLSAVAREKPPLRLSWVALFSLALAIVGGLTLVGGIAACVLAGVALFHIRRQPDRLTGATYAYTAMGVGLLLALVSLGVVLPRGRLPVGAWIRQRALAGQLETDGAVDVATRDATCVVKRTSDWVRLKSGTSGDPAIDDLQQKRDAVLINFRLHAYADLLQESSAKRTLLREYQDAIAADLQPTNRPMIGDTDDMPRAPTATLYFRKEGAIEPRDDHEGHEWVVDLERGGQTWRFLIRVYRQRPMKETQRSTYYVLRVYAPRGTFVAREAELRELLDTVRLFP